jgi:hypothetical protein
MVTGEQNQRARSVGKSMMPVISLATIQSTEITTGDGMSNAAEVQSLFLYVFALIEQERNDAEKLVGKLPPQDPACVRSYVLKDMQKQIEDLWRGIEKMPNTPDETAKEAT